MDNNPTTPSSSVPAEPPTPSPVDAQRALRDARLKQFMLIGIIIVIVAAVIVGAVFLLRQEPGETSHIRDVFIIFIALESLIIGVALVILMVQLATLINLLQNEIKPILKATNETTNTLRGTVIFLSENVTEPVIKLNEYLAGLKKLFDLVFHPGK